MEDALTKVRFDFHLPSPPLVEREADPSSLFSTYQVSPPSNQDRRSSLEASETTTCNPIFDSSSLVLRTPLAPLLLRPSLPFPSSFTVVSRPL